MKKINNKINNCFVKVNKDLIREDVIFGDIFGLEVVSIGKEIEFKLKKIMDYEKKPEQVAFMEVFKIQGAFFGKHKLVTLHKIKVNSITFDANTRIEDGVTMGGIDFYNYIGRDLSVRKLDDYWEIVGIY